MNNESQPLKRNVFTIRQFCDRNPAFTPSGIRYLVFHSGKNGFSACFKRIGRRVYVDEDLFYQCVDSNN